MCLPHIEQTPFIGTHGLLGVGDHHGLVEALTECFADQRPQHRVVAVDFDMGLMKELLLLFARDASLQDPRCAMFVEVVSDDDK